MKNKVTLLNVISSLLLQICNIVSTFIIPRIILSYFGSDVNGLVSSLTQFLSYITLVEGGITGVISASLYKPLVNKDFNKISSIIKTSDSFYKKIGLIFIIYSIVLAVVYPLFFNGGFSYLYIFALTLILSISLLIQYMFSLSLRTLLNADKKVYIVSITQIIIIILNIILVYLSVKIYPNIHILKLISGLLFILQPIIFSLFVNKNYKLDNKTKIDNELIKNRWNGFAINVAAFIHFSTDITILTIFTDFATVSIYSVYALVTAGLRSIINSISNGINPTIGQALARGDKKDIIEKIEIHEYINNIIVFFSFSVAGLLITPFVMIYTNGINDASYYQPLFGVLLLISEALYLIKNPHLNVAYSMNKFKEITIPAYIEAVINIVVSLVLVIKFGLIGVAIGTIVGMLYRMIFHIAYTKKIIDGFSIIGSYLKIIVFTITTIIGICICVFFIPSVQYTISSWIVHGICYSLIMLFLYLIMSIIFFRKEFKFLLNYLKR